MKPRIGITASCVGRDEHKYTVNQTYVEAVLAHGGLPVGLFQARKEEAAEYLEGVEGLLIPGGIDVAPLLYGEETSRDVTMICKALDDFEIELVLQAAKRKKPVFGICRGIQLINVAFGGSLVQDVEHYYKSEICHRQAVGIGEQLVHSAAVKKGSMLHGIFGSEKIHVNSYHHQSVLRLGEGLTATAFAPDGVVEAIEHENGRIFAVQCHPEYLYQDHPEFSGLFETLIQLAGEG